jgi:hypothetical protein
MYVECLDATGRALKKSVVSIVQLTGKHDMLTCISLILMYEHGQMWS